MNFFPDNSGSLAVSFPLDYPENGMSADRVSVYGPGSATPRRILHASISDATNGDGTTNTILFAENVNMLTWRDDPMAIGAPSTHEFHVGVVWLPTLTPTVGLNRELPSSFTYPLDVNHARPGSFHPNGFNVCMADGSVKFVADTIRYDVYCRLMTCNGRRAKDPDASIGQVPYPAWQNQPIRAGDY